MSLARCVIAAIRPRGWRAYLWMWLLGVLHGRVDAQALLLGFYMVASFLATAFAVNNFYDVQGDSLNNSKGNPFTRGCGSGAVKVVILNQFIAALVALAYPRVFPIYLVMVILGVLYSAPPIRLKGKAGLDVLSHSLYFGLLLFLTGITISGATITHNVLVAGTTTSLYSAFLQLRNLEKDKEYDGLAGDNTLSVRYPSLSKFLLYLTGVASSLGALLAFMHDATLTLVLLAASTLLGTLLSWERGIDLLVVTGLSLPVLVSICACY